MLTIDSHSSIEPNALEREAIFSLQANRINGKFLYVTPRQSELWREVFLKHSPIHANPEFARIYRDAFAQISGEFQSPKVFLVGLGCGTGFKELALASALQSQAHEILFSAIDVSRDLVVESAARLIQTGAAHHRSLVCDLSQAEFLAEWLNEVDNRLPRIITFFGLFPNFAPSVITHLFHALLRPGDILLASAHLAPISDEIDLPAAMHSVLPQYNNPETLAWLTAALQNWDLENLVNPPEMKIGEMEGIPAFLASSKWKSNESLEKWGHRFTPKIEDPLQLFYSLRYTPALFEKLLLGEGFDINLLHLTACRQEAIWSIQKRSD